MDKKIENMMIGVIPSRVLVPLAEGEEQTIRDKLEGIPPNLRMETDNEFRARIIAIAQMKRPPTPEQFFADYEVLRPAPYEVDIVGDVPEDLKQLADNCCRTVGTLFRYFKTREQRDAFHRSLS